MFFCKELVCSTDGCDELVDFFRVLDAFERAACGGRHLDPGAHINGQRCAAWPYLPNAIGHVGSVEPTTQDEVSVDVWRKE